MKKFIYTLFIASVFPFLMNGQDATENYVKSTTYQSATQDGVISNADAKIESVTYYDDLGRSMETISARAGGDRQNIVNYIEYDALGLQPKQYLPWASGAQLTNDLNFVDPTTLKGDILSFYNTPKYENTSNPYSETIFENSPLLRPLEEAAPGEDWKIQQVLNVNSHTVKYEYDTNGWVVKKFRVQFVGGDYTLPELIYDGSFANEELYVSQTKDENWVPADGNNNTIFEFQNKSEQVVLKRVVSEDPTSGNLNGPSTSLYHDTYYVYDDFGNLTYVLSPEATDAILGIGNTIDQVTLDKFGYQYKYDLRNRLIEKKIPGKGWEYIVYDQLDRIAFIQDANLRLTNHWLFTKYDALGRVAYTGKNTYSGNREALQGLMDNETDLYEDVTATEQTINNQAIYYTNNVIPNVNNYDIYTIQYYDTYRHLDGLGVPSIVFGQPTTENTSVTTTTQGLATVAKIRVLEQDDWITTISAYDAKSQLVFMRTINNYLETDDLVSSLLDFTGKPIETSSAHYKDGFPAVITSDYFHYDHTGRLMSHKQKIGNNPVQRIVENIYDELGQLVQKGVGGKSFVDGFENVTYVDVTHDGTLTNTYPNGTQEGWPSLATTKGEIPANEDGGIAFRPSQTNKHVVVGLVKSGNLSNPDNLYMDYGIHLHYSVSTGVKIKLRLDGAPYPNGAYSYGVYNTNDIFKVERIGTQVKFYKNNVEFESISIASNADRLVGKVSFTGTEGAQLTDVSLVGSSFQNELQDVDYAYNVRGWLTDINQVDAGDISLENDLFNFKINYNEVDSMLGANITPLYNGNISQTFWESKNVDENIRGYNYSYDDLNRITGTISTKGTTFSNMVATHKHDLGNMSYDKNGNITVLQRWGYDDNGMIQGQWDDLSYTYDGNQLIQVDELLNGTTLEDYGFKDGTNTGSDYHYDPNGNMILDNNKGITNIVYNHLNLPTMVTFNNSAYQQIEYVYDAAGIKLQKKVIEGVGVETTVSYIGNFKYKKSYGGAGIETLEFINQPEGYIIPTLTNTGPKGNSVYSSFKYVFQYKDHLDNIRLSYSDDNNDGFIDEATEIIEESNYYPFGLKQKGYNNIVLGGNSLAQTWKFGGKEYNQELGLNWYDISARNYDPTLGRWMNLDPLAEEMRRYSAYNYAFNNPIYWIDPDGMKPQDWIKNTETGKYEWDASVTGPLNTPQGYRYIGKEDSDIVTDLVGDQITYNTTETTYGSISHDSAGPAVTTNGVMAKTELQVSLRSNVTSVIDAKTKEVTSKEFNGIDVKVMVWSKVYSAVVEGQDIGLSPISMTGNGAEMNNTTNVTANDRSLSMPNSSTFSGIITAASIQKMDTATFTMSFEGIFSGEGGYMKSPGFLGLFGVSKKTQLETSFEVNNVLSTLGEGFKN